MQELKSNGENNTNLEFRHSREARQAPFRDVGLVGYAWTALVK